MPSVLGQRRRGYRSLHRALRGITPERASWTLGRLGRALEPPRAAIRVPAFEARLDRVEDRVAAVMMEATLTAEVHLEVGLRMGMAVETVAGTAAMVGASPSSRCPMQMAVETHRWLC